MAVPVSTVPAVRVYLTAAITTQVTTAGYTEPIVEVFQSVEDNDAAADSIVVSSVRRTPEFMAFVGSGGTNFLKEHYTVKIEILAFNGGVGSVAATDQRAYQYLADVETAVRNDPTLGGLVLSAIPGETESVETWTEDNHGYLCTITTEIAVVASL